MNYEFFKNELLKRKNEIIEQLSKLSNQIKEVNSKCTIGDEIDCANFNMNSAIDYEIYNKLKIELSEIETALQKIENKSYGICEMCEEEIQEDRLKIKPYAKYCIICREIIEKEKQ